MSKKNVYEKTKISYEVLKEVYKLIDEKKYDKARIKLDSLSNENIGNKEKVDYIKKLIAEESYYNDIKDTYRGKLITEYINKGKELIDNKNYLLATSQFIEGYQFTYDLIFFYYIGVCYFKLENYQLAIKYLELYKNQGFIKLEDCYKYLSLSYEKFNEIKCKEADKEGKKFKKGRELIKKSEECYQKAKELKAIKNYDLYGNGLDSIKREEISTDDEEVKELIKKGKLNDVSLIYEECDSSRKTTILALLYKNGFDKLADKLLKQKREEIKTDCPELLKSLNKNKTLLIQQAKFKK